MSRANGSDAAADSPVLNRPAVVPSSGQLCTGIYGGSALGLGLGLAASEPTSVCLYHSSELTNIFLIKF